MRGVGNSGRLVVKERVPWLAGDVVGFWEAMCW